MRIILHVFRCGLKNREPTSIFKPMAFVLGQKLAKFTIAALAVLSLLVVSVSACNCSHHAEEVKADAPSCHSHEHNRMSAENASTRSFNAECECMTSRPLPAIVAKSDTTNTHAHEQILVESIAIPEFVSAATASPSFDAIPSIYLSIAPHRLLPARAPPRL